MRREMGVTCDCPGEYSGPNCENDPCTGKDCSNNGYCEVTGTVHTCNCNTGYSGADCSQHARTGDIKSHNDLKANGTEFDIEVPFVHVVEPVSSCQITILCPWLTALYFL